MLYDIFLDISKQVIFHSSIYCSLLHWLGWRGTQAEGVHSCIVGCVDL